MQAFREELLSLITGYQTIAIYRHEFPDGDALGSQLGLAQWIKENYSDKEVFSIGDTKADYPETLYPAMDKAVLKKPYLAIVVDTANRERIDGLSYQEADHLVKIDHHLEVDDYGDSRYVEEKSGSCCEIIARLLEGMPMSSRVADLFLSGILTDTLRFSVENTRAETLRTAADLMDQGADMAGLQEALFSIPFSSFQLRSKLMTYVINEDGLGVMQLDKCDLEALNITAQRAKRYVSLMGNVEEFKIWMTIIEDEDATYMGSLRSHSLTVSDIAMAYHGGGHRLACGYRNVRKDEIRALKEKLHQRIKEQ